MATPDYDALLKQLAPDYYTDEVLLTMLDTDKHYALSVGYGKHSTQADTQALRSAPEEAPAPAKKAPAKKATARKAAAK